ncbi:MAG TPA: anti-sigma factor [Thermoanaerobaculia bacterium]|jgi:anti-sigma factor RsiW
MLTCREVSRSIATKELKGAGLWRRLRVLLHLLKCRHCRRYAAQIRAIDRAARQLFREPKDRARILRLRDAIFRRRASDDDGPQ